MSESPHAVVTPVPASTVILVRDVPDGFEVFMARRHIKSDFAPDVYVFPGGKADASDGVDGEHLLEGPRPQLEGRDFPAVGWRAIVMAAIRELFEESGLLLARTADGIWASDAMSPDALAETRDRVRAGDLSMAELSTRQRLVYAGDHLTLFSNWITPEILTRRFDTFFFLARLPEGAEARLADEFELTDCLWITPQEALGRFAAGSYPLVFATERHLQMLGRYTNVDALWRSTIEAPIPPVSPRWFMRGDERVFVIPGDPAYELGRTR